MAPSVRQAAAWAALMLAPGLGAGAQGTTPFSALNPCPAACEGESADWTVYSSPKRLAVCPQPMLFDLNIFSDIKDINSKAKLRVCNAGDDGPQVNALVLDESAEASKRSLKLTARNSTCGGHTKTEAAFQLATQGDASTTADHSKSALQKLEKHVTQKATCGDDAIMFAYANGAVAGFYGGGALDIAATSELFHTLSEKGSAHENSLIQLCGEKRPGDYTFGIMLDTTGDFAAVQKAVQSWANATCVDTSSRDTSKIDMSVGVKSAKVVKTRSTEHALERRGDCETISVHSGDSCGSLADKCGISGNDFTKYNDKKDLCSSLAVGQRVCCTAGKLPDIRPRPNPDGTCADYTVQKDDYCNKIAAANGLEVEDLGDFNDGTTWGWSGCEKLMAGIKMCLSAGDPPLPASVPNAQCGPIMPGTTAPTDGTDIADLNPCNLNSCCDIWGQCGITPEYCTDDKGPTDNPGTAPEGDNGCISNCGTEVANNDEGPDEFISVGYYEAFNWNRPCLNMRASSLANKDYTHIHWAFGGIGSDFSVKINDSFDQWDEFKKLDKKRIVSFGGWGYSTSPETYDILRQAMIPANRETFANNVAAFVDDEGLDGVDFDWEYPGAPDIPGVPPGQESDAPNYLDFLELMKGKLSGDKTLSIAAPASYWYLRPFPIANMSNHLDYIVYMTYDLHGQWDYGNEWSQEGCEKGNCLRSHVNLTETGWTLAMITKAGVPSKKITVGISSYGRSFGMTEAGCTDPDCHFDGVVSDDGFGSGSTAEPGNCTATAGYISNAEITRMITYGDSQKSWYDQGSDSNIMVWGDTNWVAYMDFHTRTSRTDYYKSLNFHGTIDWAADLLAFTGDDGNPVGGVEPVLDDIPALQPCDDKTFDSLQAIADANPSRHCAPRYTLQVLGDIYFDSMDRYDDMIANGYDHKFDVYADAVAGHVGESMHDFIIEHGTDYFSCEVAEMQFCCDQCSGEKCDYCFKEGDCTKFCNPRFGCLNRRDDEVLALPASEVTEFVQKRNSEVDLAGLESTDVSMIPNTLRARGNTPIVKWTKAKEPCPPDYSKHGYGYLPDNGPPSNSIWWTLDKEDDFYKDLLENTGIPKEKTKIGHYTRVDSCPPAVDWGDDDDCFNIGYDFDIPVPDNYKKEDVANPKDIVEKAKEKSADLGDQINDAIDTIKSSVYWGDENDLVDSVSIPVLMIREAVDQMEKVVDIADEIIEARRKAIIMAFIAAILFLVPVAGEILGTVAELADIAAIVTVLGEVGNIAFDIASVVKDPSNAPLAIMSVIFAPLALADIAKVAKAAKFRRAMKADDVAKLGDKVKDSLDTIGSIKKACKVK